MKERYFPVDLHNIRVPHDIFSETPFPILAALDDALHFERISDSMMLALQQPRAASGILLKYNKQGQLYSFSYQKKGFKETIARFELDETKNKIQLLSAPYPFSWRPQDFVAQQLKPVELVSNALEFADEDKVIRQKMFLYLDILSPAERERFLKHLEHPLAITTIRKVEDDGTFFTEGVLGLEAKRINRTGAVQNLSETAALLHAIPCCKRNTKAVGHYQVWKVFYDEEQNRVRQSQHIQFLLDDE